MRKKRIAEAQLYTDADYVRVFDDPEGVMLMDVSLRGDGDRRKQADDALLNTMFERNGRWRKADYGCFCKLRMR